MNVFLHILSTCLLLSSSICLFAQKINYLPDQHLFYLSEERPPERAAGAICDAYWTYFWEFGDASYSTTSSSPIKYCYAKPGSYEVRVSLVPHYSHEASKTITRTIQVSNTNCERNYSAPDFKGFVNITTNATSQELIPNNEIQVAIDYKMPNNSSSRDGYLFLFYNKEDKKIGFDPLVYKSARVYEAAKLPSSYGSLSGITNSAKEYLNRLVKQRYDYELFRCEAAAGESGRMFLTLKASNSLDTVILKKKKSVLRTDLKAVFIPKGRQFNDLMVHNYPLKMASVHDPNRMRILKPSGNAIYKRSEPETFVYEVEFQNEGGRAVPQVNIEVPWDKNMDMESLVVLDRTPNRYDCPVCPEGFDPAKDSISCFEVKKDRADVLEFVFYNVMVHGKREPGIGGKKYTKGFVRYQVDSNRKKQNTNKAEATILFKGGEAFTTKPDQKNWKHKGFGIRIGRNFGQNIEGFERRDSLFKHWNNIGLYYRTSRVKSGITWLAGGEVSLAGFSFVARNATPFFIEDEFVEGFGFGADFTQEELDLQVLDIQIQAEARWKEVIGGGVGGGISVPMTGEGRLQNNFLFSQQLFEYDLAFESDILALDVNSPLFDELLRDDRGIREEQESNFGILDEMAEGETTFLGQDVTSNRNIGAIFHWYLEAGLMNNAVIGLRQDFRIYPDSYKQTCVKFNNFQVYLRLKLFSQS
ncbi:MAG: hypothetical protein AAF849_08415 [Bacteroidota bacterium]